MSDVEADGKRGWRRHVKLIVGVAAVVGVGAFAYTMWRRRQPHLIAAPVARVSSKHPVLIINPGSGGGKAKKIGLASAATALGIETIVRKKGEKIPALANSAVDRGADHLLIAGGDGSQARVAQVAIDRDVAFSCVPSGTRNHLAMDLGLDRSDPKKALSAAFDGVEFKVDVGRIAKRLFVNNVSFGIYADAIADPDYREHKAKSIADAAAASAEHPEKGLSVTAPDGTVHDNIGMLLASNNPYQYIGAPDFAGRAALDTGLVGVIVADRSADGPSAISRGEIKEWTTPKLTIESAQKKVPVGIDGSLHKVKAPIDVEIDHAALSVVLPRDVARREIEFSTGMTPEAFAHLAVGDTSSDSG
jgi:diacylglycerol kinase family enzyme